MGEKLEGAGGVIEGTFGVLGTSSRGISKGFFNLCPFQALDALESENRTCICFHNMK